MDLIRFYTPSYVTLRKNPACGILSLRRVAFAASFRSAAVRFPQSVFISYDELSYETKKSGYARHGISA